MTTAPDHPGTRSADRALDHWRRSRRGFAPLYCEPVVREAIRFLFDTLPPGALVVDLGSGEGQIAEALAAGGCRPVAVDLDRPGLAATRGASRVQATAEALPLRDASVDAVYCFSVLQYTERSQALSELRRVLRPGGRFAVVENLAGSPWARLHRIVKRVTGERDPARLTPLRHLRWSGRHEYQAAFTAVTFRAADLFSPALLLFGVLYGAPADLPPRSIRRRMRAALDRFDRAILERWPDAGHASWLVLMTGRR